MSRHRGADKRLSKLSQHDSLGITLDSDLSHQKMWNEKVEEAKHIQEQKQIDRILQGIVKERLFGHLLSQESRISTEGFYALDRISRKQMNPIKLPPHKKVFPSLRQRDFSRNSDRPHHRTIDVQAKLQKSTIESRSIKKGLIKRASIEGDSMRGTQRVFPRQRTFSIAHPNNLNSHFRQLTNSPSAMIYDIKLTKQLLSRYNRTHQVVNQQCLDRFLYFFGFPNNCHVRQFSSWLETVANCSMKESSFFAFQTLDESANGFLSISDLFRALQDFPRNEKHEREIYEITELIKKLVAQLELADIDYRVIAKPTVQEIIIRNHTLRLEELRDLVKESNKELVSAKCVKSTTYHQSLHALEHDAAVREKKLHLESEERVAKANRKYKEDNDISMKQDGIRYKDFAAHFGSKRPYMFVLVMQMLLGEEFQE